MSDYEHDGNIFTGIEDELREHREYEKNYYSGGGGSKEPQGCGCCLASGWFWLFAILYWLFMEYCEHKY